jgi:hypothetical protein
MLRLERLVALVLLLATPAEAWVATKSLPSCSAPRLFQSSPAAKYSSLAHSRMILFSSNTALPPEAIVAEVTRAEDSPTIEASTPTSSPASFLTTVQTTSTTGLQWDEETQKKFINGLLLAVSFGWAAWTILGIDNGMTRGWTQSEVAMRIPLDTWFSYEDALALKPVYTKTLINVVIYLLGDWLSQTVFQKKNVLDFDAARTLRNGFIGLCFGPLVHEYYQWSDHILPPDSLIHRLEKIFMDQTLYLSVKASVYVLAVGLLGECVCLRCFC